MKIAFGLKAHSGWAAFVAVGGRKGEVEVIDRRRLELVADDEEWAKAPYHAAEDLKPQSARALIERSLQVSRRNALREMHAAVKRATAEGHDVAGCAVLMGAPMPDWSIEEIRAVHFRMHKAEGVLWRAALQSAAEGCDLRFTAVPEKELISFAARALGMPAASLPKKIAALGKGIGPPWGKDQKDAALAAMVALAR